jgi:hypothetical protein
MIADIGSEIKNRELPPPIYKEFCNAGLSRVEHGRTGCVVGRYAAMMFSTLQKRSAIKHPV